MEVTKNLAQFITDLTFEKIPSGAVKKLKMALMDAIGCGMYGLTTDWGKKALSFSLDRPPSNEASLWGGAAKRSAMDTALGNGVLIHSFDYDDYHNAKMHPGSVVIPAVLSVGEWTNASGKDLLTALTAGYETMIRISLGTNPNSSRLRGWHLTGTTGTFGAAAAAGKLLNLNKEEMTSALGLAGTQSAGLWAFNADGAMSKRFHPGRSSQSGVMAALLAKKGFTGPSEILETEDGGFCKATSDDYDLDLILKDINDRYHTNDICFKPYSCCGSIHSSIDATINIMENNRLDIDQIQRINVLNSEVVRIQTGWTYKPTTVLNAQMSLKYCVAVAALYGDVKVDQFTSDKITDSKIIEMTKRIHFVVDPEIDQIYPEKFSSKVEMTLKNGDLKSSYVESPKGSADNPMTDQEILNKFNTSVKGILSKEQSDHLINILSRLEKEENVSAIGEILSQGKVSD